MDAERVDATLELHSGLQCAATDDVGGDDRVAFVAISNFYVTMAWWICVGVGRGDSPPPTKSVSATSSSCLLFAGTLVVERMYLEVRLLWEGTGHWIW